MLTSALRYQPVRYYSLAAVATVMDLALFQSLVFLGASAAIAAAFSCAAANVLLFVANRVWTFRSFRRRPLAQARTYGVVVGIAWTVTIAVVAWCTTVMHLSPLTARCIAFATTVPIGFFGHKYLTYRSGFRAGVRELFGLVRTTLYQRSCSASRCARRPSSYARSPGNEHDRFGT